MRSRPTRGSGERTVEVELVEDDDATADVVLDAMAAARNGAHRSLRLAREEAVSGPGTDRPDRWSEGDRGPDVRWGQDVRRGQDVRWGRQGAAASVSQPAPPSDGEPQEAVPEVAEEQRGRTVRRRARGLAVAATAVAVVVAANLVQSAQESERLEALADVPGILERAGEPLVDVWRTDTGGTVGATVEDLVLLRDAAGGLQAVDGSTGEVRWSRQAAGSPPSSEHCVPLLPDGSLTVYRDPPALVPGPEALLLCLRSRRTAESADVPRVSVVEAATGTVRHPFTDVGAVVTVEPVGDGLVLVSAAHDGHLRAVRWDRTTNEERWRFSSEHPIFAADPLHLDGLTRDGDVLLVDAQGRVAVDLSTGQEVDAGDRPARLTWLEETPLDAGRTAVWRYQRDDDGEPDGEGHVRNADGRVLFPLLGPLWRAPVHDGSAPNVLVTAPETGTVLLGVDSTTGRRLWRLRVPEGGRPLLQTDGVLLVGWAGSVEAVDVRQGTSLWTAEVDRSVTFGGMTDGVVVLLPVGDRGHRDLVAYGLHDGGEVWRAPLPTDLRSIDVTPAGDLVLSSSRQLVGLG